MARASLQGVNFVGVFSCYLQDSGLMKVIPSEAKSEPHVDESQAPINESGH